MTEIRSSCISLGALLLVTVQSGLSVEVASADAQRRGHHHGFFYVEAAGLLPQLDTDPQTSTTDVDLVDLDGDGDLDLFFTHGTAGVDPRPNVLLFNDGSGAFSDVSATHLPVGSDSSTKTAFGDLDGDGDLDAIVGNVAAEQLLLNDGNGKLSDASDRLPPAADPMADISAGVELVDLDGDGDLDVLIANENPFDRDPLHGAQNRLLLNEGSAVFSDATERLPTATEQTSAILTGDVDADGDADIVVINRGQNRLLINDGSAHFVDETDARLPLVAATGRSGGLADMDGDGDLDLVVLNSANEPLAVYKNDGAGAFTPQWQTVEPYADETDTSLALVDLDNDGDLDLHVSNAGPVPPGGHDFAGGPDRFLSNVGRGWLVDRTARHFDMPSSPSTDAAFGDIDGDGDLDLVVGNSGVDGAERVFVRESW